MLLLAAAAASAVLLARQRPNAGYAPVAALLVATFAASSTRYAIDAHLYAAEHPPYVGSARALFHVEQALYITTPFGLLAVSLVVFVRRSPWPLALAWAATVAALVLSYPALRGDPLRRAYLAITLIGLLGSCVAFAHFFQRREAPELAHVSAMFMIAIELLSVVKGPWGRGLFESYTLAQAAYAVLYGVLTILQGVALWSHRRMQ
jgi:hypothetical protein